MATIVDLGTIQGQRAMARTALDDENASLAANRASLETLLSAVGYNEANDAAAAVLQASISTNQLKIARLERRLALLAHYESIQDGGNITLP